MDIFRYSSNAWGQTTLEGAAWELLPLFFWGGVLVIVTHAIYMWFSNRNRSS